MFHRSLELRGGDDLNPVRICEGLRIRIDVHLPGDNQIIIPTLYILRFRQCDIIKDLFIPPEIRAVLERSHGGIRCRVFGVKVSYQIDAEAVALTVSVCPSGVE